MVFREDVSRSLAVHGHRSNGGLGAWFSDFLERQRMKRVARQELARLDERQLQDIGLTRFDVEILSRIGRLG